MKQNKYQIISFKKTHIPEIRDLYYKAYNRKKPLKIFKYKLDKTPYGKPIAYLMKYEKSIVGFYVIAPIIIKVNDKKILGGMSFLTMTHPDHQRKGIFIKLAKKTFSVAKKKGYKFVIGWSISENSLKGFQKLGFKLEPIFHTEVHEKKAIKSKKSRITKNNFPKNLEKLWLDYKNKDQYNINPEKNREYVKWRFQKNPIEYFTIYEKGKYFIVLKKFDNILNIIDFFGNIINLNEIVLNSAINEKKKLQCDQITIWLPKRYHHKKMKNILLKRRKSKNYFGIKKLDKNLTDEVLKLEKWYFTMAQADHF